LDGQNLNILFLNFLKSIKNKMTTLKRGQDKRGRFYKCTDNRKFHYTSKDYNSRIKAKDEAENHQRMIDERQSKIELVSEDDNVGGSKRMTRQQLKKKRNNNNNISVKTVQREEMILEGPDKGDIRVVEQPVQALDVTHDVHVPNNAGNAECFFCGKPLEADSFCNC